jgi:hypothetical protein
MRRDVQADSGRNRPGIVLLITLVILVILATLAYTLSAKVAARRHRNNYLIDYTQAQYACDSAMKYALTSLNNLDAQAISRPNDPDFSDVFAMSDADYEAMLARFAKDKKGVKGAASKKIASDSNAAGAKGDSLADSDSTIVPGPYGPAWPLIVPASEIEIGSAQVKIEVEDENAKYPLGWALMADPNFKGLAGAGCAMFLEWMKYSQQEVTDVQESLAQVGLIRPFKVTLVPTTVVIPAQPAARDRPLTGAASTSIATRTPATAAAGATPARGAAPARGGTPATTPPGAAATPSGVSTATRPLPRRTVTVAEQELQQGADMARLFEGGMIDTDLLTRPTVVSSTRTETAMKYLGLWGTRQVNVNTAPRHVLEAALMFGSVRDAPKMATAIISRRKTQPFASLDDVKKSLFQYSDSIDKCKNFITTTSTILTVRVTAVSGVAKVVAVAGFIREGRQVKRIAVISE